MRGPLDKFVVVSRYAKWHLLNVRYIVRRLLGVPLVGSVSNESGGPCKRFLRF